MKSLPKLDEPRDSQQKIHNENLAVVEWMFVRDSENFEKGSKTQ